MADDHRRPVRRRGVVLLLALGATVALAGVAWVVIAEVSLSAAARSADRMLTLPVHTYTQYTQRSLTPDYTGLVTGTLVLVLGVLLVVAGAITSTRVPRVA